MDIVVASDHAGYSLKEFIKNKLLAAGHKVEDVGTDSTESVDYPDPALRAAEAVSRGEFQRGIIICGTGIGVAIVANKVPGIRAALCHGLFSAAAAREHNDANILTMGEKIIGTALAWEVVEVFLKTSFAGGRHSRRLDKIKILEDRG